MIVILLHIGVSFCDIPGWRLRVMNPDIFPHVHEIWIDCL